MPPLISVIIPAFRAESFIARSVASVLNQTHDHCEAVISSDDMMDYAEILHNQGICDPRIRFTSTGGIGRGPSAARNAGLYVASGNIVAMLDADDAFAATKLERVLPHVIHCGAATTNVRIIDSVAKREFPSLAKRVSQGLLSAEDYLRVNLHTYSALVWDRKRADVYWDESLHGFEELLFGVMMYNTLEGIYYDPAPLHDYYKRAGSMTDNGERLIKRVIANDIVIDKAQVRDALIIFMKGFIALEKEFVTLKNTDPVMGWYHFLSNNTEVLGFTL
jgi:glycosyltransferase involved in cell wall biosynthesis